ncbi:MAG: extracellular solute-binding protein [Lachnospiraceae bacterium]
MRKSSKYLSVSMAALLLASSVTGCGASGGAADAATDTTEASAAQTSQAAAEASTESTAETSGATDDNTITICMQNDPGKKEGWEAVAKSYMALHPEINIVVDLKASDNYDQWVQTAFTTADASADLVAINLAGDACTGKSINYMDYLDNDSPYSDGAWRDQFDVSQQQVDMSTGTMDALSLETVQVIWLYNQNIFDEVGIEAPTTWDELVDACKKLQDAGYQPIAMDGDYNSFYAQTMGWLAQVYADQTTRSIVNTTRAQKGDYCYDPDIDGTWEYDPSDPWNDDADKLTQNPVRAFAAIKDGTYSGNTPGMKTVWSNFAKVFPEYVGGDAFFGTNADGAKTLFYQGKAAMMVNGAWGIVDFNNDMSSVASGKDVEDSSGNKIENISSFKLGTFNMPSMEGEGIEAKARTIEVSNGFIGCISKNQEHDDKVVDFLMYYSSKEGMSSFMEGALAGGYVPNGPSLVYDVEYPEDIQAAFDSLTVIGNVQKDFNNTLARGLGESAETFREFYEYSYDYLTGAISLDDWATKHEENIMSHFSAAMKEKGLGESDLANPQNEPTGN